jgi:hypothetical protein
MFVRSQKKRDTHSREPEIMVVQIVELNSIPDKGARHVSSRRRR